MASPSRRIELAGPLNFRDIGGYPTADGRRVRWRQVFRSDSLFRVSPEDAAHIVDTLGLATIVDLRTDAEIDAAGRGALESSALDYHHLPIFDEDKRKDPSFFLETSLESMYMEMLRDHGPQVVEVLRVLARSEAHPLVFHCAAGKDRTGIVAAVLLGVLGVAEADIVEDYALTAEIMPTMVDRLRTSAEREGRRFELPGHVLAAEAATLEAVLAALHEDHASLADYAASAGLAADDAEALRAALLED